MSDLYEVHIFNKKTEEVILRVPLECDFHWDAKTFAGHILRGVCVEQNDYSYICRVYKMHDHMIVGIGHVVENGKRARLPNKPKGLFSVQRTAEEEKERRDGQPLVNKVVWHR